MTGREVGRVVLITGGSSGIGRATARRFAEQGWRVGLIARGEAALEEARRDLSTRGATVATASADVADSAALRHAADTLVHQLGPMDVWINNAGISVFAKFTEITEDEFRRVTDVNYLGTVNGTRIALDTMLPRNSGTIINVCSAIGFRGTSLQAPYSGSKYAMRGFTEAVRSELLHQGSRVHLTLVYPPSVNTPFYQHAISRLDGPPRPPPPIYQPELVAKAIHFAAIHHRREVLVGGQTVLTRILNRLAPDLTDRILSVVGPWLQTSRKPDLATDRDENVFGASQKPSPEHGAFDSESLSSSVQVWVTRNRGVLTSFGAAALVLYLLGRRR